jgi:hypothetical protein
MKMKKTILTLAFMVILTCLSGCKKSADASFPVRISFFDIRPQRINENESAWLTIAVSNLSGETALVKSLADQGNTSPSITYTTGNPVYIEYHPPEVEKNESIEAIITITVIGMEGSELDRAEGKIRVDD